RGIDAPFATPFGVERWRADDTDPEAQLDVSIAFLSGFSALKVEGRDGGNALGQPTVLALTYGHFRFLTPQQLASPPFSSLPPGTVPAETLLCELPYTGAGEQRQRNNDRRSPDRLLYLHLDRSSFESALRARLSLEVSRAEGARYVTELWRL